MQPKKSKKTIILLVVLAVLVLYLIIQMSGKKGTETASTSGLVSSGSTTDQGPLGNLLSLLQSINTINLNGSIFTRNDFKYLKDLSSGTLPSTSQFLGGRYNPFLPYDPQSNGSITQATPETPARSIQTGAVQSITGTGATVSAKVSTAEVTEIYFEYGKAQTTLDKMTAVISTKEDGTVSLLLGSLEPNTTYFIRAVLNGDSPIRGNIVTFKTLAK
jgi:hypothetical protein